MLLKVEESRRIRFLWIGVVDVPKLIEKLLVKGFDMLDLFLVVLVNVGAFLSSCAFDLVRLSGFFGQIAHLMYSAFGIGTSKVFNAEQEFHDSCQLFLLV